MSKCDWLGVDWSVAPEWANYWCYSPNWKKGYWCKKEPTKLSIGWCTSRLDLGSPDFGFKGNWKDSLEERPK